jgi:fido (protein-threonine AMPylation protein)
MPDWIGYRWLIEHHGLTVTQALRIETVVGRTRATVSDGTTERRTVQELLRPDATAAGHLSFALKHEGVHLEALSRLFATAPTAEVENWIRREPTGQYARRAGFLYEWLTGRRLDVTDTTRGNYVSALDPERELSASTPVNNVRWRVRDNLLGSADFSPQVHLTPDTERALTLDVRERLARLEGQFSAELVLRSAMWLAVKESRASFAIEHEENKRDRIQRFAAVIEQRTGQSADPLSTADLEALQREILGPNALHYGLRRSPVFVGESARFDEERVHYVGPHWDDVPALLDGLRSVLKRTSGLSPVARAALVSFGFVYLHPMVDGNGRISRFLINDLLRRDGALPAPYIVPISAILQKADLRPLSYDGALEIFSRPLMQQYRGHWSFGPEQHGEDGVKYNLQFDRYDDALHAWRYPDLTPHVAFLAEALDLTIEQEMRAEAQYLQRHGAARARLKSIVEGPDSALDRIIRSVRESHGALSGKLRTEYPILQRTEIADDVVRAIREEFPWTAANEG